MTKKTSKTTVILNGKEFDINERLPKEFLKKDFQWIPYIDISIIRDILRQMGVLKSISFWPINKVAEGQNSITYTQKAVIELTDWTVLEGDGYMNISNKKILSWAAYWVLSNLKSRAVKSALTYYKKIFELPIEDEEEVYEQVAEKVEKKGKTDIPIKTEEVDLVEEFVNYINKWEPKNVEEFKKLKSEFIKKYANELKKMDTKKKKKLWEISQEFENSFKS